MDTDYPFWYLQTLLPLHCSFRYCLCPLDPHWVTRTPLKIGGELRCSGRVGSSCSTSGTRHVKIK
jgi:hypothetical protein